MIDENGKKFKKSDTVRLLLQDPANVALGCKGLARLAGCNEKLVRLVRKEIGLDPDRRERVKLDEITHDPLLQLRAKLDDGAIARYAEAMQDPGELAKFDPLKLVDNGVCFWLVDGYHRVEAARLAGLSEFSADIYLGDFKLARRMAYKANAEHTALVRTNADKRKAVITALNDPDLTGWSNYKLADLCGVTEGFIRKVRRDLEAEKTCGAYCTHCEGATETHKSLQQPDLATSPEMEGGISHDVENDKPLQQPDLQNSAFKTNPDNRDGQLTNPDNDRDFTSLAANTPEKLTTKAAQSDPVATSKPKPCVINGEQLTGSRPDLSSIELASENLTSDKYCDKDTAATVDDRTSAHTNDEVQTSASDNAPIATVDDRTPANNEPITKAEIKSPEEAEEFAEVLASATAPEILAQHAAAQMEGHDDDDDDFYKRYAGMIEDPLAKRPTRKPRTQDTETPRTLPAALKKIRELEHENAGLRAEVNDLTRRLDVLERALKN